MFKRFDTEDVVLSSELTTFPTWFNSSDGDTDLLLTSTVVISSGESSQGFQDFYTGAGTPSAFDPSSSKSMFSVAYASASVDSSGTPVLDSTIERVIYGQYRALVLGDEESDFYFGAMKNGESATTPVHSFFAITIDRSRFREKVDPRTCKFLFATDNPTAPSEMTKDEVTAQIAAGSDDSYLVLAPDLTLNEKTLDAGRVYELAKLVMNGGTATYVYAGNQSYGWLLPDIGVILINAELSPFDSVIAVQGASKYEAFARFQTIALKTRSQESVPSNYVFVRVRNGEFNYSMNPTNIDELGNIKDPVRINQPQSYVTSVGLYNDSNDLIAVAKLSKPLVKDFTKEALIRIKVDY